MGRGARPAQANLTRAEDSLKRALEINPDLSLAHNLYVHVEVEAGRARDAMVRLLGRTRDHASEPELFAGLVHACRYCGLLDASEAAYERARRLDPAVVTSVAHTFLMKGDYERAIATDVSDPPYVKAIALAQMGRVSEALVLLHAGIRPGLHRFLHGTIVSITATLEGRQDETATVVRQMAKSDFSDPEGFYYWALALAQAGDHEGALELLERSVDGGFHAALAFVRNPWLDPLRAAPDFSLIVRRAETLQHAALEAFRNAEGPRILGVPQL